MTDRAFRAFRDVWSFLAEPWKSSLLN